MKGDWLEIFVAVLVTWLATWMITQLSITQDCEKLGRFASGSKAYTCEVIKK